MDALRKAAAAASSGIKSLDGSIRSQAQERVASQPPAGAMASPEAVRRATALMAPSASTAAAAPVAGSPAPRPTAMGVGSLSFATPVGRGAPPASLMDAPAGGGVVPGAAAALDELYGDLSALRHAVLASPATPQQPPPGLDVSALADMLRIDIVSRRVRAAQLLAQHRRTAATRRTRRNPEKGVGAPSC
jgi:hypothetical protein